VLRLVLGLDGPTIATLTGHTPGSVRVHLHRGLALLRPLLEKEGWA
jgi:RNA polymerase sigma-70 factor (ECF subfamily)